MSLQSTPLRPDLERPLIRAVEALPVQQDGQEMICLRDPERIAPHLLFLPLPAFYILTLFDGNHSITDMQAAFMRQFSQLVPRDQIETIIRQLDEELYLESETYKSALRRLEEDYRGLTSRPAAFAGTAYAADPAELGAQLAQYLQAAANGKIHSPKPHFVQALVSPHIDLHRGGRCFGYAYRELKKTDPADLYIVFGTGHQIRNSLMVCTTKSYDTPLGLVETDTDFIERFAQDCPLDVFSEETLHRNEHSIEFQALWLRYMLGSEWKGKIVPILSGSLHTAIRKGRSPRENKGLAEALDKLRTMIKEYPGKVTVIAGADMSHVGKRFGHEQGIPPEELQRVERDDRSVLDAMASGDAETFFASIEKQKDCNNVCGLSPIYMTLDITRPEPGHVLQYEQAIEEDTESVVSFASVCYYSKME